MTTQFLIASRLSRVVVSAGLVAGFFWTPAPAEATPITQSLPFHLDVNSPILSLDFEPFNPAAGVLRSVEISFADVSLTHNWWLWNIGGASRSVDFTGASLSGAALTIGDGAGTSVIPLASLFYTGTTGTLDAVTSVVASNEMKSLRTNGTPPPSNHAFHDSATTTPPVGGQLPVREFNPSLTFGFDPGVFASYDAGLFQVKAESTRVFSTVAIDGIVTVTYNVPESVSAWLLAPLWGGLIWTVRARRTGRAAAA